MNIKYLSSLAALGSIAVVANSAMAESVVSNNANFACINESGIAVTVSQLNGDSKPIFRWQGDLLASLDANPTELCQDAAIRLNEYVSEKYTSQTTSSSEMLSFRADQQLGLPTICATDDPELGCEAVLFTLSPTDKPVQTANNLLTDILEKDLQGNKIDSESNERGVQSISYSISILDLIFGSKYLK
ncbi:MAG: COP23 domain-containing protein [Cyanobacteria bacterium P01_F01_bin.143]